jgi:hypothetical protein
MNKERFPNTDDFP